MGMHFSWLATRGSATDILEALDLRDTGVPARNHSPSIEGGRLASGWFVVVRDGFWHPLVDPERVPSYPDATYVACSEDDNTNSSIAWCWADGRQQWQAMHLAATEGNDHIQLTGDPPASTAAFVERARRAARDEGHDALMGVPADLAEDVCGFRYPGQGTPAEFTVLEELPWERAKVRRLVAAFLQQRLPDHRAFGTNDQHFTSRRWDHDQTVEFWLEGPDDAPRCEIRVEGRQPSLERVLALAWGAPLAGPTYRVLLSTFTSVDRERDAIRSREGFRTLIFMVDHFLLRRIGDLQRDVRGVDELLNASNSLGWRVAQHDGKAWLVSLVAARLAGNPTFATLAERPVPALEVAGVSLRDRWPQFVRFLAEQVTPQRFAARDPAVEARAAQLGKAYRTFEGEVPGEARALADFHAMLRDCLGRHGFVAAKPLVLRRQIDGGHQTVALEALPFGALAGGVWCETRLNVVTHALSSALQRAPAACPATHRFSLHRVAPGASLFFPRQNREEIDVMLEDIRGAIANEALPILDCARELHQVDAMLNGGPEWRFESFGQGDGVVPLVVAHLVGRPVTSQHVTALSQAASRRMGGEPVDLKALGAHLAAHVAPAAARPLARSHLPRPSHHRRDARATEAFRRKMEQSHGDTAMAMVAHDAFGERIDPILETLAFSPTRDGYVRQFEGGHESIRLTVLGPSLAQIKPLCGLQVAFQTVLDEVAERYLLATGTQPDAGGASACPVQQFGYPLPSVRDTKWLKSYAEVEAAADDLEAFVSEFAIARLVRSREIKVLEEAGNLQALPMMSVVVAWMARSPDEFERLAADEEAALMAKGAYYLDELASLRRLVACLRTTPRPVL